MPTPKKLGSKPNPLKRFMTYLWHHPKELVAFLILLALIILPLSLWITSVRNNHAKSAAIAKERAQFTQAEVEVNSKAQAIIVQYGTPDGQKKRNECTRTSGTNELFPDGELYCYVDVEIAYPVLSQENARTLAAIIATGLGSGNTYKQSDSSSESTARIPVDLGSQDYAGESGLDCSNGYTYFRTTDDLGAFGFAPITLKNSNQGLLIELNCLKRPVIEPYF